MFSRLCVFRLSAPLFAQPGLIRSRAKPTWAKAAMPRSSAASQIGSKSGWEIDRASVRPPDSVRRPPPTGASGMTNARLPSARIRAISATDHSTSPRSIWVTGISRSVCPSTVSVAHRFQHCRMRCCSSGRRAAAGLDERADEERRVEELHVDATRVAEREARVGSVEGIVAGGQVVVGLQRVGQLEVLDEPGRHEVEAVRRLLRLGQLGERGVGEPEHAAGDVHEPRRRPERLGELRIGALDPVEWLVQVAVDIDDPHGCPPARLVIPRATVRGGMFALLSGRSRSESQLRTGVHVWDSGVGARLAPRD